MFVRLFVFLFSLKIAFACECAPISETQHFCESDFVAHVTLNETTRLNETDNYSGGYRYSITYKKIYKSNTVFELIEHDHVYTSLPNGACGLVLDKLAGDNSTDFLLAGSTVTGKLTVSICGWNSAWKTVSKETKKKLEDGYFAKQCKAKI